MMRLADKSWPDLTGRRPLVVLPVGSCEQHGPHLPLDTDQAVAQAVAERAAALLSDDTGLLLAPGQPYGASGEHEGFPGTVSIGHSVLRLLIVELGRSMLRWADRLLVVNGHGGNLPSVPTAIATLRREGADAAWWPCLPLGSDLHAGYAETSMMLRLRSAAVHAERAVAGPCEPMEQLLDRLIAESVRGVSESGVLGDPAGASAQHGEQLLAGMAVQLAEDIEAWRVSKNGRLGSRSPRARTGAAWRTDMTGKQVAVVTDAARGSGAAVVQRLANDGWTVITVDRCADDPDIPYPLARAGQLADRQLTRRLLEPEEVAWACTPEADAVTGSVLHADGGFAG